MSKQVIVLGNHRSGSSCLAGVLHKLGVIMGIRLLGEHPSNPVGHYEDLDFLHLNDSLVGNWRTPNIFSLDEVPEGAMVHYRDLINERNFRSPIWGVKDPRLCITARYFKSLLGGWGHNTIYVIEIRRSLSQVTRSLMKRDLFSHEFATKIATTYEKEKDYTARLYLDDLNVQYEQIEFDSLTYDPETVVNDLCDFLNFAPRARNKQDAINHVNPSFRNFK